MFRNYSSMIELVDTICRLYKVTVLLRTTAVLSVQKAPQYIVCEPLVLKQRPFFAHMSLNHSYEMGNRSEDPLEETDVALDRVEWTGQEHEMQRNGPGILRRRLCSIQTRRISKYGFTLVTQFHVRWLHVLHINTESLKNNSMFLGF